MIQDIYILITVSILFILLFWIWSFYLIYRNPPHPKYYLNCNPGQCATNLYNGEKRCGINSAEGILYDPFYEVCNSKYYCDNKDTPYALLGNGSTNVYGVCEPETTCRCLKHPQCSINSLVVFSSFTSSNFENIKYFQSSLPSQGYIGNSIIYSNNSTQHCFIDAFSLNRLIPRTPKCNFISPTISNIANCINENPCIIGMMALIPSSLDNLIINPFTISEIPIGCVPLIKDNISKTNCPSNQIPVWDYSKDNVKCFTYYH